MALQTALARVFPGAADAVGGALVAGSAGDDRARFRSLCFVRGDMAVKNVAFVDERECWVSAIPTYEVSRKGRSGKQSLVWEGRSANV